MTEELRAADGVRSAGRPVVYVGRQPIVDVSLRLVGYELLYRDGPAQFANFSDGDAASYQVTARALLDIGYDALVGPHFATVNVSAGFLADHGYRLLPPERTVLEILENIEVTDDVVSQVAEAAGLGYRIALDDYTGQSCHDRLAPMAAYIKIDVLATLTDQLASVIGHIRRVAPQAVLVAEKVEDAPSVAYAKSLGCELFQGYFVGRPELCAGRQIPAASVAALRLMAELQRPDVSLYELTEMIERDPVLAYRLLRLVNSASFAIPGAVTSIRRALVLIGLDQARRLASVLTLTVISGAAGHLSEQLVVRAKMCELVADTFDVVDLGSAFSAGLFSGLDLLLGMPMDAVVAGLGLSDPVRDALVTRTGALGRLLEAAVAYERGEAGGEIAVWSPAFGEALRWAASLRNELEV